MASHVVMLPPAGSPQSRAEQAVLVRDGFSWPAFLVPPLWLLWHRLWAEAIVALLILGAFTGLGEAMGAGAAGSLAGLLVSLYVGLEGQAMRIAGLMRRGFRQWGVVEAANADEAYMRYACEEAAGGGAAGPAEPEPALAIVPAGAAGQRPVRPASTFGLVPYTRS